MRSVPGQGIDVFVTARYLPAGPCPTIVSKSSSQGAAVFPARFDPATARTTDHAGDAIYVDDS